MFQHTVLASLLMFLCSCGIMNDGDQTQTDPEQMIEKAVLGEPVKDNPSTEITNVEVDGNVLKVKVSYSGGCEDQTFRLVGSTMIMKSIPPKRKVTLERDSKGDACRELITKDLLFDISELAYKKEERSEIILQLSGYEKEIKYLFKGAE